MQLSSRVQRFVDTTVPDLTGKVVLVTGASGGLGLRASLMFAMKGAKVVMACRNKDKAAEAKKEIVESAKCGNDKVVFVPLDLASLASVRRFRSEYVAAMGGEVPIDVFCANAGIVGGAQPQFTEDGFEESMGVNVFGHFALLSDVFDLVRRAPKARVTFLSSFVHENVGKVSLDDLKRSKKYDRLETYNETKLADFLVAMKLVRLLKEKGINNVVVTVAHPGFVATNLQHGLGFVETMAGLFGQRVDVGSTPIVLAATDPNADQGAYAGPYFKAFGLASWGVGRSPAVSDERMQDELWSVCEDAVGKFKW